MGWKSTIDITRRQAISAIEETVNSRPYDKLSNEELKDLMYGLGIGDDTSKPYFGYNFNIQDEEQETNN